MTPLRFKPSRWAMYLCVALVLTFGVAELSWGRAGGGRSFGGGFRSSGSSFRSSRSSSWGGSSRSGSSPRWGGSSYFNSGAGVHGNNDFTGMEILVVVLIVIVLVVMFSYMKSQEYKSPASLPRRVPKKTNQVVEQLRQLDPTFNLQTFQLRFRRAFERIQDAWQNQNLSDIRQFVSDRLYERFELQIQEQKDLGYREVLSNIKIDDVELVEVELTGVFEVLTVGVTATMVDYQVSLKDGAHVSGDRSPETFIEYWSFVRKRGAESSNRPGLLEGVCPVCGDTITFNQFGQCQSCNSLSRNGEYDWVLSEITQESVWKPRAFQSNVADWYAENYDPGFNIQHIEDRASVIFWRKAMADRLSQIKPLNKVATDEFCETYADVLADRERLNGRYEGNCSVGSVELAGFVIESEQDLALVKIQYSCHTFENRSGKVHDLDQWRRVTSLMVLMRKKGVMTDLKNSVSSTACPNCGAPESNVASHACQYCDTVLNQGTHDWVLTGVYPFNDPIASSYLDRSKQTQVRKYRYQAVESAPVPLRPTEPAVTVSHMDSISWMVQMAIADHHVDEREKNYILAMAQRGGVSPHAVESMIHDARQGTLELSHPSDRATAKAWIGDVIQLALIDGHVAKEEKRMLVKLGKRVDLSPADINLVIAKRMSQMRRDVS